MFTSKSESIGSTVVKAWGSRKRDSGRSDVRFPMNTGINQLATLARESFGLPFRALARDRLSGATPDSLRHGFIIVLPDARVNYGGVSLPLLIVWPGFIANALCIAVLCSLWPIIQCLRRASRIRRGLCPACGHQQVSGSGATCPECGFSQGTSA
jgi:hypothetical protein